MTIDSHQHVWRLSRGDYGWLTPALAPLYRDFGMADIDADRRAAGISGAILVQAAETIEETRFLLDVARTDPMVMGVVGWVDMASPHAPADIAVLAENDRLKGLRPMLQDMADTDWILSQSCHPALVAMEARKLAFDALVRPRHLPAITALARRHPGLAIVLDHAGKPDPSEDLAHWRADLAALAACPNVVVKLSGLVTEAGPGWTVARLRPIVDALLEEFGPDRILWGSDWPVLLLAATHDAWWTATGDLLAPLGERDRAAILGGNAARVYRLAQAPEEAGA